MHPFIRSAFFVCSLFLQQLHMIDNLSFSEKKHLHLRCAFFVVTSDAACWKAILISLCSNEFSNIPPKLRSHDAAHTTVRSHFYKKIGFALLYHLHPTIMSKPHSGMNTAHIDKIYSFLVKNIRFTCVCAFFVVTLRVFCRAKGK